MGERVFIGIPTLNRPALVRETIASVQAQTYGDYRVVVSDNVSDAGVADSVRDFVDGLGDARFTFHRQPENVGEYGQGRFFFREASDCRYMMILHDDDVIKSYYLENAVAALEKNTGAAFFVANPYLMDEKGVVSVKDTMRYRESSGRARYAEGEIDVLHTHMFYGFTPISGTVFRMAALVDSGFVDEDCHGNFPFECNIFLRLGERGAKAWYLPEELLGFRFHSESLRNYLRLTENPQVVETMIRIFSRRRFTGPIERRRRVVLSSLYRARMLIRIRSGDRAGARLDIMNALRENIVSPKAWFWAPVVLAAPGLVGRMLTDIPEARVRPKL